MQSIQKDIDQIDVDINLITKNENIKKERENQHINNELKIQENMVINVCQFNEYQSELITRDKDFKNNMITFIQELTD